MIYEGTVAKAWDHTLDDGAVRACFTLAQVGDHAFVGASDWLPLLKEAIELGTRVRVMASEPETPGTCADPLCGDGCCDDLDCTNVPEEERTSPFTLRADTVEWL